MKRGTLVHEDLVELLVVFSLLLCFLLPSRLLSPWIWWEPKGIKKVVDDDEGEDEAKIRTRAGS